MTMEYLRLMKYPGAKTVMLPELISIVNGSGCSVVVDVFGGSGLLSLNLDRVSIVYNDLDPELYNLFLQIRNNPTRLKDMLISRMEDLFHPGGREILQNRSRNEIVRKALVSPASGKHSDKGKAQSDPVGSAEETLFRFNASFGGLGQTYSTYREKSPARYLEKTLAQFDRISARVHRWQLENLDFRSVIDKYDSGNVLFYLDPPYPGKEWYNFNFREDDFRELKSMIDRVKGYYILNVDANIPIITSIFGRPTFLRSYPNRNSRDGSRPEESKIKAFYLNFQDRASHRKAGGKGTSMR
jgi:DNA adenine methylase